VLSGWFLVLVIVLGIFQLGFLGISVDVSGGFFGSGVGAVF
jgi:hypothetical protein